MNIIKQWLLIRENKKVIKKCLNLTKLMEKDRMEKLEVADILMRQADLIQWHNEGHGNASYNNEEGCNCSCFGGEL